MNDSATALPATLQRAVSQVLRALFRLLLRHGFSYTAFDAVARRVYVDLALREFGIPGKKPSVSRASILSGLTRKEVQRLVEEAEEAAASARDALPPPEQHNRAGRVLAAWARERDFADAAGRPRRLPLAEGSPSFAELVRRFSGDMPARAVLDELERLGAVRRTDDGFVEYVKPMFLGRHTAAEKIDLLGHDVADLITTIDHNVQHGDTDPRFQRKVMYRDMPASVVPEFRMLAAAHGMAVLQQLDVWLAAHREGGGNGPRPAAPPPADDGPKVRLGLGIYYFEAPSLAATPADQPGKRTP
jgi:hypothetical protein